MKIKLVTACGCCSDERELPDNYRTRYIEVPIYQRMANPIDEIRSMEQIAQQDIHIRRFEFEGMRDDEGRWIYREVFQP